MYYKKIWFILFYKIGICWKYFLLICFYNVLKIEFVCYIMFYLFFIVILIRKLFVLIFFYKGVFMLEFFGFFLD